MSSNKRTIEKNQIEQTGKVKYWQPILGKAWCYHTMKSAKDSVNNTKHDWKVSKVDFRNSYNT